eukprot:TCONS_00028928-protein
MVFLFSLIKRNWCCIKVTTWWYYLVVERSFGNTNQGKGEVCVRHAIATAVHQFFFNQGIITDQNFLLGDSVNQLDGTDRTIPIVYHGWKSKCMDQDSNLYYDFYCNVEKVEDKNDKSKSRISLQERNKLTITWNRVNWIVIYASYIFLANLLFKEVGECVKYDDCGLEKFYSIHSPLVIFLVLFITIWALDYNLPFIHPKFLKENYESKSRISLQERNKLTITWIRVNWIVIYALYICLAVLLFKEVGECVKYDDCGLEKFYSIHSPLVIFLVLFITIWALDYNLPFIHPKFLKENDESKSRISLQERNKLTITWIRVNWIVIYALYICLAVLLFKEVGECVKYDDCGLVIFLVLFITIWALDYNLPFIHPKFLKDRRALDQYLLVYRTDVSNHSLHCVYISSIVDRNGGKYNCINSWGDDQRYPQIPVEQEGNELWRVKVHYVSSSSKAYKFGDKGNQKERLSVVKKRKSYILKFKREYYEAQIRDRIKKIELCITGSFKWLELPKKALENVPGEDCSLKFKTKGSLQFRALVSHLKKNEDLVVVELESTEIAVINTIKIRGETHHIDDFFKERLYVKKVNKDRVEIILPLDIIEFNKIERIERLQHESDKDEEEWKLVTCAKENWFLLAENSIDAEFKTIVVNGLSNKRTYCVRVIVYHGGLENWIVYSQNEIDAKDPSQRIRLLEGCKVMLITHPFGVDQTASKLARKNDLLKAIQFETGDGLTEDFLSDIPCDQYVKDNFKNDLVQIVTPDIHQLEDGSLNLKIAHQVLDKFSRCVLLTRVDFDHHLLETFCFDKTQFEPYGRLAQNGKDMVFYPLDYSCVVLITLPIYDREPIHKILDRSSDIVKAYFLFHKDLYETKRNGTEFFIVNMVAAVHHKQEDLERFGDSKLIISKEDLENKNVGVRIRETIKESKLKSEGPSESGGG